MGDPVCNYCSPDKVHGRAYNNKKFIGKMPVYGKGDFFLQCELCDAYMCSPCMGKFLGAATKEDKKDPVFQAIFRVYSTGPHMEMQQIVGACCIHRHNRQAIRWSSPKVSTVDRIRALGDKGVPLIDGSCYVAPVGLFVPNNGDVIDIHGFGGMKGIYNPMAHCVPGAECVADMGERGIYPQSFHETDTYKNRLHVEMDNLQYDGTTVEGETVSGCDAPKLRRP